MFFMKYFFQILVDFQSTVGSIRYYSILKNNTLLLQNAFEEGEDAPEGLAPKGYYDNSKQICKVKCCVSHACIDSSKEYK